MAEKEEKAKLKRISAALKLFPKIVAEKKRAHREKEKVLKRFAATSKMLKKLRAAETK